MAKVTVSLCLSFYNHILEEILSSLLLFLGGCPRPKTDFEEIRYGPHPSGSGQGPISCRCKLSNDVGVP